VNCSVSKTVTFCRQQTSVLNMEWGIQGWCSCKPGMMDELITPGCRQHWHWHKMHLSKIVTGLLAPQCLYTHSIHCILTVSDKDATFKFVHISQVSWCLANPRYITLACIYSQRICRGAPLPVFTSCVAPLGFYLL